MPRFSGILSVTMYWHNFILIGASAIAGAINAVAGGGTLLTFPALLAAGYTSNLANATSTVALWPGQLSSLWGYRDSMHQSWRTLVPLLVLGLTGGLLGAWLLVVTPVSVFDRIVPFLVLTATVIFAAQGSLSRWSARRTSAQAPTDLPDVDILAEQSLFAAAGKRPSAGTVLTIALFLFAVSVYGGYFGAGIGILTLAAFGFLGMTDIHQMNGIKAFFTLGINGIAAVLFVLHGLVNWQIAGIMAVGSIFGGWAGAGIARRIGQKNVRRIVIAIGVLLTISLLLKH